MAALNLNEPPDENDSAMVLLQKQTLYLSQIAASLTASAGSVTLTGVGSPEGVVTGVLGQRYLDFTDTAAPRGYTKTTPTGNTGWV